jgi:hypothetical protein
MDQTRINTAQSRFLSSTQRNPHTSNIYSTPPNYPYQHQVQRISTGLKRSRHYDDVEEEGGAFEEYVNVDHHTPIEQTVFFQKILRAC